MSNAERVQRMELDVDTRLAKVWRIVWGGSRLGAAINDDETALHQFGSCIRAAYGLGYGDALREDAEGKRGELGRANGYERES